MPSRMSDRHDPPFASKTFTGRSRAVGATRWITPAVMVPWPYSLSGLLVSRIEVVDWSRIDVVD
jgi:hypothetical protein